MKNYGFGVDIGGTTIKLGLFNLYGVLLEKWEIPTNKSDGGVSILDDVALAVHEKMMEKGIDKENVQGIGLGVPGPVNRHGVVQKCVNLGWGTFDVEKALSEKTGLLVKASNDANTAALGEAWQGSGKGHKDVVMITLGTGVGGGIILNGKIISGFHGSGGEIGHMHMSDEEEEYCGCGKKGCLEQYASATGIVRLANKKLKDKTKDTVLRQINPLTAEIIFNAAKEGDAVAAELVEYLCKILGTAIARITSVIDPEIVIIGGGVSRSGQILLAGIRKYYDERAFFGSQDVIITLASLGNDAGIYGGAKQIFDE
ncbi:MAG: ROK family glucokinase [Schaedlerella sp.]|nr:ROK family glucokinase [Schaedlerella sp.]